MLSRHATGIKRGRYSGRTRLPDGTPRVGQSVGQSSAPQSGSERFRAVGVPLRTGKRRMAARAVLDVVHLRARGAGLGLDHVGNRRAGELVAQRVDGAGPHLVRAACGGGLGVKLPVEQLHDL